MEYNEQERIHKITLQSRIRKYRRQLDIFDQKLKILLKSYTGTPGGSEKAAAKRYYKKRRQLIEDKIGLLLMELYPL